MQNDDEITYDSCNRMNYHQEFHFANGKRFTESELEYMCKFYDVDDARTIGFALGRTEKAIFLKTSLLKKSSLFDYYKNLNKHW